MLCEVSKSSDLDPAKFHFLVRHHLWCGEGMGWSWKKRSAVFESQNWRCCYCGVRLFAGEPHEDAEWTARRLGFRYLYKTGSRNHMAATALRNRRSTIEHVINKANGGEKRDRGNLVGACLWCNTHRSNQRAEDWYNSVQGMISSGHHPHGVRYERKRPDKKKHRHFAHLFDRTEFMKRMG